MITTKHFPSRLKLDTAPGKVAAAVKGKFVAHQGKSIVLGVVNTSRGLQFTINRSIDEMAQQVMEDHEGLVGVYTRTTPLSVIADDIKHWKELYDEARGNPSNRIEQPSGRMLPSSHDSRQP